jgi:hypothetical protein
MYAHIGLILPEHNPAPATEWTAKDLTLMQQALDLRNWLLAESHDKMYDAAVSAFAEECVKAVFVAVVRQRVPSRSLRFYLRLRRACLHKARRFGIDFVKPRFQWQQQVDDAINHLSNLQQDVVGFAGETLEAEQQRSFDVDMMDVWRRRRDFFLDQRRTFDFDFDFEFSGEHDVFIDPTGQRVKKALTRPEISVVLARWSEVHIAGLPNQLWPSMCQSSPDPSCYFEWVHAFRLHEQMVCCRNGWWGVG